MASNDGDGRRRGVAQAAVCYVLWGIIPVYWKLLSAASSLEVLAQRMVWSCVFIVALCALVKRIRFLWMFRDERAVRTFATAGLLIAFNWGLYVWATTRGYLLEAGLGYFLSPLASIVLGVAVFKERLSPRLKVAVAFATFGVGFYLASRGGLVIISVSLAVTFAAYGAIKKKAGFDALPGLAFESVLTGALGAAILVVGYVVPQVFSALAPVPHAIAVTGEGPLLALFIGSGLFTVVPLLLYSEAANRIPLSLLGFLQYISPSISTLIAVFAFGEQFTLAHAVCFVAVWTGLSLTLVPQRKGKSSA